MESTDSVKSFLQQLGLTQNESAIYKTLLETGLLSVSEVAKNTGVNRTNVYHVLESLKEKELVEETQTGKKITYRLSDPSYLMSLLEAKKSSLNQASVLADAVLPEINSQFSLTAVKPLVRYYQGAAGLKEIYGEIHRSGVKTCYLLRSIYDIDRADTREVIDWTIAERKRLGIGIHILAPLDDKSRYRFEQTDKDLNVTRRIVESKYLHSNAEILIWGTAVSIVSYKENVVATTIYNPDIAQTHKQIFDYIWDKAKPYHDKITINWKVSKNA